MNFSDFINSAVCNQEPQKGLYGQTVSNYYCLKNIKIKESLKITDTESLWVSFNDKENRLDIYFILLYKKYNLAEIGLELSSPFQFEFIAKSEKKSTIQDAILLLDDEFNFTFSIELTAEKTNIVVEEKKETKSIVEKVEPKVEDKIQQIVLICLVLVS